MIKYCILSLLLIIITMPLSLFAQNDEIDESYFLDINEAKEAIARLEKNNEENTKRINDLENQNKQMTEENNQNKAKLESANRIVMFFMNSPSQLSIKRDSKKQLMLTKIINKPSQSYMLRKKNLKKILIQMRGRLLLTRKRYIFLITVLK